MTPTQNEPSPKLRERSLVWRVTVLAAALLAIASAYVLSIGPAVALGDYLHWPHWYDLLTGVFYWPIIILTEANVTCQQWFITYTEWCTHLIN
jgi:hypothetical protein